MCFAKCGIEPKKVPKKKVYHKENKPISKRNLVSFDTNELVNFDEQQYKFLIDALNLQKKVLNSQEFAVRFLSLKCRQKELNGMPQTLKEIYNGIISGSNNISKIEDFDLDYSITLYESSNTSTLGSTSMSTGKIRTNKAVFNRWMKNGNYASLASHLFHEYLHSMGYLHKWDFGRKRQSMVYRAGYLMRDMVNQVLENKISLTPVRHQSSE